MLYSKLFGLLIIMGHKINIYLYKYNFFLKKDDYIKQCLYSREKKRVMKFFQFIITKQPSILQQIKKIREFDIVFN